MEAIIWIFGIVIVIFGAFKLGGKIAGYGVTAFWFLWTLGFSTVFVGYALTGPLASIQLIIIIIAFLYSRSEFNKNQSQQERLDDANSLIAKLKNNIKDLNYDTLKQNINRIGESDISVLETPQQHREKLLETLDNAKERIIILSGWVMNYSVNDEFRSKLRNALVRGVDVFIGYGYKSQNESLKKETYNYSVNYLQELQEWSSTEKTKGILEIFYYPNHAKILISDQDYAIYGSFNWLSNGGETINEERSCVISKKDFVGLEARNIITSLYDPTKPQTKRQLLKRFVPFSRY